MKTTELCPALVWEKETHTQIAFSAAFDASDDGRRLRYKIYLNNGWWFVGRSDSPLVSHIDRIKERSFHKLHVAKAFCQKLENAAYAANLLEEKEDDAGKLKLQLAHMELVHEQQADTLAASETHVIELQHENDTLQTAKKHAKKQLETLELALDSAAQAIIVAQGILNS